MTFYPGNHFQLVIHYPMDQYRKTPRASFLDYNVGDFFITICTENKKHFFGEIHNDIMHLSHVGEFVRKQLASAKDLCVYAEVKEHVVMPNHIHAIVKLCADDPLVYDNAGCCQRSPNPFFRADQYGKRFVTLHSKYINSLKGAVTKYTNSIGEEFGWQERYHDHFIREHGERDRIAEYIANNIANWNKDCFFQS